jgi:hypothetical protein
MATVDLASLTAVLQRRFEPDVVSQIQRAAPMLQVLGPNVRDADSHVIQWDVKFGSASAGSAAAIAEGADVSTFNTDTKVPAVLSFGTYHDAFEITGKAIASAIASGNPAALAALFESEIRDSAMRLSHALATEFYSGDGSGERMMGLLGGAILDSGTYAAINRATYPQWRGNIRANGGVPRAVSFELLRGLSTDVYKACGLRPNFIVCGPSTHDQYGSLFGPQRRYITDINTPGGVMKLSGGYRALEFDGVPLMEDVNCPEGKFLFLNLDYLLFRQLPQPGQVVTRSMGERPLETAPEQTRGGGPIPVRVRIQGLAITGDKYRFALYVYPQVQVRRPQAFGILSDISY